MNFIPTFKKKGFCLNGYNYIGPLNDYSLEPIDIIDFFAMLHDKHYDKIIEVYGCEYPYLHFNKADQSFINNLEELNIDELNDVQKLAITICVGYFKLKKLTFPKSNDNDIEFNYSDPKFTPFFPKLEN